MPEALPAVTVPPSRLKAGFSLASFSMVVPGLTYSSVSKTMGSPFFWGMTTGTISSLNLPSAMAAAARVWLRRASSSCISRVMPYFSATFSAVMPMWQLLNASHRPSLTITSVMEVLFMRAPQRAELMA